MKNLRSLLFVPGNNPAMLQAAGFLGADAVILDLEDAVAMNEKDAARRLVTEALTHLDFGSATVIVRVNGLDTAFGADDIRAICTTRTEAILLPKATAERISEADALMARTNLELIALLESALGVEMAYFVAKASPRVQALFFGAEDFTADMGVPRTKQGHEIEFARARVALACRAAGVQAVDTPFTDTNDPDGFTQDVLRGRVLGYTAKALISPRHVMPLHDLLQPDPSEVAQAHRIVDAAEEAFAAGIGVFSLEGKMIDAPIINRAKHILSLAALYGGGR
ncbi:MAG: citrate lyase subunit beta [Bacillota bacterium]|nr:MAG: citrate lyase subunit beta [Bacillota bacterium]MBS3950252.1 HpcH/HpaI aldolase/citrate lyase family protein [Peptococcaceae bacterium]